MVVPEDGSRPHWSGFLTAMADRMELEAQLHQAQRMEAVGQLAVRSGRLPRRNHYREGTDFLLVATQDGRPLTRDRPSIPSFESTGGTLSV